MRTRIHVNAVHLRQNKADKGRRPVFTVRDYKSHRVGNYVKIYGPSELHFVDEPLRHGARAYIETQFPVKVSKEKPK